MRNLSKKSKAIIASAAIAGLASAGGAYAYWTTTGSGNATATTGSVSPITVNQTATLTSLYPGGPDVALSGTFTNPGTGTVHVATVSVAVGTLPAGCVADDFTINNSPATVGQDVAAGTHGTWSGISITMNNTATSQNSCQASDIPLVLSSN